MATKKRAPTTLYLDPKVLRGIKVKAALNDTSVSELANEALRQSLVRDAKFLEIIRKRRNQPARSYEDVLIDMKRDGLL
ncbi:MAG: CopG family transcriptional regulator [Elusimicrobia bacterium]|nr:CopG family transcriptional regulator [Elusimicrobiota bacterium]